MRIIILNPKKYQNQGAYLKCILDIILDLQYLVWYQGYKLNNPINYDSNRLKIIPIKHFFTELTHLGLEATIFVQSLYINRQFVLIIID